jgi:3-isopropylmalate/(R)-2-methylmalate dehydratase small subunit
VHIFKVWGVQAVITESAARIWFRNAIAAGLPVFELPHALKLFNEGDTAEIDMTRWTIRNASRGDTSQPIPAYPPTVSRILEAGGILNLLRERVEAQFTPVTGLPE